MTFNQRVNTFFGVLFGVAAVGFLALARQGDDQLADFGDGE